MKIFYNYEKEIDLSLALGFFDGIHRGHKKVIENAVNFAKKNGLKSAVVSFVDHPSCFILNRKPEYIIPIEDKIEKIKNLGADYLYLLNFDEKLKNLSKEQYFDFLQNMTSPKAITTGFNHYFGKNKMGNTDFLENACSEAGIVYKKIEPVKAGEDIVSSSLIRKAIMSADFEFAKTMTGYDFYIKGLVIKGSQTGQKMGYRTVNIKYPDNIIKIPYGVYCSQIQIDKKLYNSVTNWGIRPTITEYNEPVAETHIFDFDENIYAKPVKLVFLKKIREEQKFGSLDELKNQISRDAEFCKNYFKS